MSKVTEEWGSEGPTQSRWEEAVQDMSNIWKRQWSVMGQIQMRKKVQLCDGRNVIKKSAVTKTQL